MSPWDTKGMSGHRYQEVHWASGSSAKGSMTKCWCVTTLNGNAMQKIALTYPKQQTGAAERSWRRLKHTVQLCHGYIILDVFLKCKEIKPIRIIKLHQNLASNYSINPKSSRNTYSTSVSLTWKNSLQSGMQWALYFVTSVRLLTKFKKRRIVFVKSLISGLKTDT